MNQLLEVSEQVGVNVENSLRCGAIAMAKGGVQWRIWAPACSRIDLILFENGTEQRIPMRAAADGCFTVEQNDVAEGKRYCFEVNGNRRADPCSLYQPDGVAGTSAVFFPHRFSWSDQHWRGLNREALSIYELHVGSFTREGTFDAIIGRLPELKDLGITAIELMPLAQFPGARNWGYDGVLPYAAQESYGGPRELQRLVDAAHGLGIGVILDVVYNHFGPEGSFLREFALYFTDKYKTPWGDAINFDDRGSEGVRKFILDNARMWLEEFHLDGLRLDAVHAIYDLGARHILREIGDVAREVSHATGRTIHIIAESDLNDPRVVNDTRSGGHGLDAQWCDDFHHAVHAFLTGERNGYYMDYGSASQVAKVLNTPFIFAGEYSKHRSRRHGAPADGVPSDRFVVCIQNHDQVGNRALGDRLSALLASDPFGLAKQRLATCLMLLSPYVPMLFMGEEYGETNPFPFFCSFESEELSEAVRRGRRREFADFVAEFDEIPDPTLISTFESARLQWDWPTGSTAAKTRELYKQLLRARQTWSALSTSTPSRAQLLRSDENLHQVIEYHRGMGNDSTSSLQIFFNLGDAPAKMPSPQRVQSLLLSSEHAEFGGSRTELTHGLADLLPYECVVFGAEKDKLSLEARVR